MFLKIPGKVNSAGFSLVEILIALALMAVLSGLFAKSMMDLSVNQNEFSDKNDSILFLNSLNSLLVSNQAMCSTFLTGKTLPPSGTNLPLSIAGYSGFGGNGGNLQAGSIITGAANNTGSRLAYLNITTKGGIPDVPIVSNGVNLIRRIAVIKIGIENRRRNTSDQFQQLPERVIEFPVYVSAGGIIQSCFLTLTTADVCQMIGATVDGSGNCAPAIQCQVQGSYATSSCSPGYGGCATGVPNIVTGGQSCPAGVPAAKTGEFTQNFTVTCGKKCSYDVANTISFYICMKCS